MSKHIRTFFTNPDLAALKYGRTMEMEAANEFFELMKKNHKNLGDMVKHELRVTGYELRVTSYQLRVERLKPRVEIQKREFKSTSYEFESTSYEFESTSYKFKSTSYEFKSTSYEFQSTRSRIIKSMKTEVNSLKSSSFSKIISPKLFGKSYVVRSLSGDNFLLYVSTTPWLRLSEYTLTLKEET